MSTPKYTKDGVKVRSGEGSDYFCGHCGEFLTISYGFKVQRCPKCGMFNRGDFSLDLPSERIAELAKELGVGSMKHDSVIMGSAANRLWDLVREVEQLEKTDRMLLGGTEPVEPSEL